MDVLKVLKKYFKLRERKLRKLKNKLEKRGYIVQIARGKIPYTNEDVGLGLNVVLGDYGEDHSEKLKIIEEKAEKVFGSSYKIAMLYSDALVAIVY